MGKKVLLAVSVAVLTALIGLIGTTTASHRYWEVVEEYAKPSVALMWLSERDSVTLDRKDVPVFSFGLIGAQGTLYNNISLDFETEGVEVQQASLELMDGPPDWYFSGPGSVFREVFPEVTDKNSWTRIGTKVPVGDKVVFFPEDGGYLRLPHGEPITARIKADLEGEGSVSWTLSADALSPYLDKVGTLKVYGTLSVEEPKLHVSGLEIPSAGSLLERDQAAVVHRFELAPSPGGRVVIQEIHGTIEGGGVLPGEFTLVREGWETLKVTLYQEDGSFRFVNMSVETAQPEQFSLWASFVGVGQATVRITDIRAVSSVNGKTVEVVGLPLDGPTWKITPKTWGVSNARELIAAMERALPGEEIILAHGVYDLASTGTPKLASGVKILGDANTRENVVVILSEPLDSDRITLDGVSLIQTTQEAAIVAKHLTMWHSAVWTSGAWGVRLQGGEGSFLLRNNIFWGGKLLLDVAYPQIGPLSIGQNLFAGNGGCGVDLSIDVVFSHLPVAERLAAFEEYKVVLQQENTFYNKSVCGARG